MILTAVLAIAVPLALGAAGAFLDKPWSAATAAGGGFVAAQLVLTGVPPFPPIDTTQWIVVFGAAGTLMAFLESDIGPKPATVWKYRLVALSVAIWLTLRPFTTTTWPLGVSITYSLGFLGLGLAFAASSDALAKETESLVRTTVIAVSAATAAVSLALSGSVLLAQLAGSLAAGAAGIAAVQYVRKTEIPPALTAAVFLPFAAIVANGHLYSNLPLAGSVLLLVAPAVPLALCSRLPQNLAGAKRILALAAAAAIPGLIATGIALVNQPAPYSEH